MPTDEPIARFEPETDYDAEAPTLIEGFPGLGLVASIAIDQITKQLELPYHGSIQSADFPPVAGFKDGRVREPVRVHAGSDPAVMTLHSDIPIPPNAIRSLSRCVHEDLAAEFARAVFLTGSPAESEDQIGEVIGIATDEAIEADLKAAGITLADGEGAIGGVTGGLLADCYHNDVPAATLVVRCNPYIPDPAAARDVIEEALEPLVEFDIDTQELVEQAEEIQRQKQHIAEQLKQYQQSQQQAQGPPAPSMYQ